MQLGAIGLHDLTLGEKYEAWTRDRGARGLRRLHKAPHRVGVQVDVVVYGHHIGSVELCEPFVARGFTPDSGATYLLARVVGLVRARRMLLLGEEVSGEQAADWGLVHEVVEDEALEAATEEITRRLAESATFALGLTKWLMHRSLDLDLADALSNEALALELSARSRDFKEGLAAFAKKRSPRYEGR